MNPGFEPKSVNQSLFKMMEDGELELLLVILVDNIQSDPWTKAQRKTLRKVCRAYRRKVSVEGKGSAESRDALNHYWRRMS